MNPVTLVILLLICAFIVLVGRVGYGNFQKFLRLTLKKLPWVVPGIIILLLASRGAFSLITVVAVLSAGLLASKKIRSLLKNRIYRPFAFWAEHLQSDSNARTAYPDTGSTIMTKEQAYQILGLEPGQSREAITIAYRRAMKKTHPDQGGSSDMAIKLNLARDLLLSSHV